ncbi:MAG: S9 family peptidase, partial [Phycisphaerales bacterium]|nr:S9 family peptidase [Phycisphaerales bacterium]
RAFLEQFAKTNRFRLGEPGAFKVTPDGSAVLFLRSEGPESFSQELWMFDAATGKERKILSAADLLGKGDEKLTAEELARRERMRMSSRGIASFQLSKDGKSLLVPLSGRLFRVLMAAVESGGPIRTTEINTGGSAIDPRFSPDGNHVGFVRDGELWISPATVGEPRRISPQAKANVSYGEAEFVAQEEMKRMHGFWWSPDSRRIMYQQTDNSALETFYIPDPADPAKAPQPWKYPRAGKANSEVTLWISPDVGSEGKPATAVKWDRAKFPYLARVEWPKHGVPTILVQNREQTEQVLLRVDIDSGETRAMITEKDAAWIGLEHDIPSWLPEGKRFLWLTEQGETDGWEVQARSSDGTIQKKYPTPGWQIEGLNDVCDKADVALLSAVPADDSAQMQVLRLDLKTGDLRPVTAPVSRSQGDEGGQFGVTTNDAMTLWVIAGRNRDGTQVLDVYKGKPGLEDGTRVGQIRSVAAVPSIVPQPEWVRVQANGREYAAVIIRPRDFDPKKKYPVIDFVYGGPGSNQVNANARAYLQNQWFADQGFIVVSIDGRGTPRRGREWSRVLKKDGVGNFIDAPLADQCDALEALTKKFPEMDRERIGVFGWSFGGYFSSMATMRRPDVFKAGAAGAPVTDWRDYDTHYTERYLGLPDKNKAGYDASDVLTYAKDLRVPLLVIQGTADDNVYFVHSLKLTDRLFREGKPFEFVPLASQTHMVTKPEMVLRLNERIAEFFERTLGKPK